MPVVMPVLIHMRGPDMCPDDITYLNDLRRRLDTSMSEVCTLTLANQSLKERITYLEAQAGKADTDRWATNVHRLEQENDVLRGLLAKGGSNCVYCGLAAEDISKCKHGFPGCSRMDDLINAPQSEAECLVAIQREMIDQLVEEPELAEYRMLSGATTPFVGAGHRELARVKTFLKARSLAARARYERVVSSLLPSGEARSPDIGDIP